MAAVYLVRGGSVSGEREEVKRKRSTRLPKVSELFGVSRARTGVLVLSLNGVDDGGRDRVVLQANLSKSHAHGIAPKHI